MKTETSDLTGAALNWAISSIEDPDQLQRSPSGVWCLSVDFLCGVEIAENVPAYCTNWAEGGPLIDKYDVAFSRYTPFELIATVRGRPMLGPTRLIAAMRAIVAAELGDVVEAPDDLA